MVNVHLASAQTSDMEQKRRKQTLERAKANHLSRQLQMRLQYAKLKVDHGWQKQNLNEVENLYFRHSHMRGPRPSMVTTFPHPTLSPSTQAGSPSSASSTTQQSNLSFRPNLVALRPSGNNTTNEPTPAEPQSQQSSTSHPQNLPTASDLAPDLPDLAKGDVSQGQESPAKTVSFLASPASLHSLSSVATPTNSQPASGSTTPTRPSKSRARLKPRSKPGTSLSPSSPTSASPYRQNSFSTLVDNDVSSFSASNLHETSTGISSVFMSGANLKADPSQTRSNVGLSGGGYSFGSSAMTYDSFWSSHSSASAGVRLSGV